MGLLIGLLGMLCIWVGATRYASPPPPSTPATQLKIAPAIVTTTYIALVGMLAVAGALAFGLGGREVASDMLRNAYDSGRRENGRGSRHPARRYSH